MGAISKTKKARRKRLLAAGYLPEELPTPFNSNDLAKYRDALLAAYKSIPAQRNGDPWYFSYKSTASPIYFPRFGKQDRKHYILNPISFFFLSQEIADSWVEIRKVIGSSKISASQPIFDWTGDRALVPLNFNERSRRLADLSVANNVLVKSDVARFFHSIYTHAFSVGRPREGGGEKKPLADTSRQSSRSILTKRPRWSDDWHTCRAGNIAHSGRIDRCRY